MTRPNDFKALVVTETEDKQYPRTITTRTIDDLPAGEVIDGTCRDGSRVLLVLGFGNNQSLEFVGSCHLILLP